MAGLPEGATEKSRSLYGRARELVGTCPDDLARSVALTGSTSRGIADRFSDIELNLWVTSRPQPQLWRSWLEAAGAEHVQPDLGPIDEDGWSWTTFRYRGTWVEMGLAEVAQQEDLFSHILAGEVTDHARLGLASMVERAVVLRDDGFLDRLQERLRSYPPNLAGKIVASNTEVWSDPHVPPVRLALAERGDRMALALRITWDIQNVLCILFALNQTWEPDWKWTAFETERLRIKPENVGERINRVFTLTDPHQSVKDDFRLILDTLDLVPDQHNVSGARESVDAALRMAPIFSLLDEMREGYMAGEGDDVDADWEVVTLEDWPEWQPVQE